jgi:hypothetical protein
MEAVTSGVDLSLHSNVDLSQTSETGLILQREVKTLMINYLTNGEQETETPLAGHMDRVQQRLERLRQ